MQLPFRLILQHVDSASLLMDNEDQWEDIGKGVILYLTILKDATEQSVDDFVEFLFKAKIYRSDQVDSKGRNKKISLKGSDSEPVDIMVIPQFSLAGKIKNKQVQYHGNLGKEEAENLYALLCQKIDERMRKESKLVAGSYGNRQGLQLNATSGPLTHIPLYGE